MICAEILRAVGDLNDEERQLLRQHFAQRPEKPAHLTPKERMRRLNPAFAAMSEGLNQAQLDEMTAAMTED